MNKKFYIIMVCYTDIRQYNTRTQSVKQKSILIDR